MADFLLLNYNLGVFVDLQGEPNSWYFKKKICSNYLVAHIAEDQSDASNEVHTTDME